MAYVTITARFSSTCRICGRRINGGESIGYNHAAERGLKGVHLACIPQGENWHAPNPPEPAPAPTQGDGPSLMDLFKQIETHCTDTATAAIAPQVEALAKNIVGQNHAIEERITEYGKGLPKVVRAIAAVEAKRIVEEMVPRTLQVQIGEHKPVDVGLAHHSFDLLIQKLADGQDLYLHGPAGTGKTTAAEMAARAFGDLPFACISLCPQSPASLVTGHPTTSGEYVPSEYFRIYSGGGIYIADELDNGAPAVNTLYNTSISQGFMTFPVVGLVRRHPNFRFIGAGNTPGRGKTWDFPERNPIGMALLDRCASIFWGYDEKLESALVARMGAQPAWLKWVRTVRAHVGKRENGIHGVCASPRASIAGARDITRHGSKMADCAEWYVFRGLEHVTRDKILGACPLPE